MGQINIILPFVSLPLHESLKSRHMHPQSGGKAVNKGGWLYVARGSVNRVETDTE